MLTVDLAELVQTPQIRAFYGWEGSVRNRVDGARRGDAEQVALLLGSQGYAEWWDLTRPFFEDAPETVAIARDAGDALCGFAISVTPANAPPVAERDVLLGPWLAHAREHSPDGNAILFRDAVDFTRDTDSQIQAMINMAGMLRSGPRQPAPRLPAGRPRAGGAQGLPARDPGARTCPELDVEGYGHKRVECWLVDYGPGGLLGAQRDTIYLELGMAPPGAAEPPPAQRHRPPRRPTPRSSATRSATFAFRTRSPGRRSLAATASRSVPRPCARCSRTPPDALSATPSRSA